MKMLNNTPPPARPQPVKLADSWPPPKQPLEVAHALGRHLDDQATMIRHWRGTWLRYNGSHWAIVEEGEITGMIYATLRDAVYLGEIDPNTGQPEEIAWNPNRTRVVDVQHAYTHAVARLTATVEPGSWIDGTAAPGIVSTPAGLLDLATRAVKPADPRFFTTWSLPFSFDPAAPAPTRWAAFLSETFADDPQAVSTLQEWMGYLVSGRTDLHKAMYLQGRKRSGKGTILRLCAQLVGEHNAVATTPAALTGEFGLQEAIGKTLLTIGDLRLTGNTTGMVSQILNITGGDMVQVNRKNRDLWNGYLGVRFMFAGNGPLDLRDASGAATSRFLILKTTGSAYDREDHTLGAQLAQELPGILAWALDGLDRVNAQHGHFTQSVSSVEAREEAIEAESPMQQFLDAATVTGEYVARKDQLYTLWKAWAERKGYSPGSETTMGHMIGAVAPELRTTRPRGADGSRQRVYNGLGISRAYITAAEPFGDREILNNAV